MMSTDNRLMIMNLQKLEHFYILMAKATGLPFAECDPETFDDQVAVFEIEQDAKNYAEALENDNYPTIVTDITKEKMQAFYTGLYLTGINRVAFHNGSGFCYLDLNAIVTVKKPEQKENMPPVMNDSLQLTAVYFLQELRRPNQDNTDRERAKKLQEMEQELIADLRRSRFVLAIDVTDVKGPVDLSKPNSDIKVPYLKNPAGDVIQPIFSDLWEYEKFRQKNPRKLQALSVSFQRLVPPIIQNAKGFALNPAGFNLLLQRDKIEALVKQQ